WRASDPEHRGCFGVNCLTELVDKDETLGNAMEEVLMFSVDRYHKVLELAVENQELDDGDLKTKAQALQSVVIGVNTMAKVIHEESELWNIARYNLQSLGLYRD
ncbi:hypothetical protein, partial [Photobacterium sp. OFAV2-7]|uniref:TetR family transcriptional regulator C-terminal domain-containing protein n=1 Tax=Photobacterium sp. OFAV2-7 TaxID=2917748 RepID=UPI001EF572EF